MNSLMLLTGTIMIQVLNVYQSEYILKFVCHFFEVFAFYHWFFSVGCYVIFDNMSIVTAYLDFLIQFW